MTEVTKENKEKLKALESNIKTAFKEERFEQVSSLANDIKVIDPENRLVARLLEKMEKGKADAKKKENATKIKEYDTMLAKQMKDGNLGNVHRLTEELKELDADLSAKWNEKAQKAEADVKRKENADKIKNFEIQLKLAFKEKRFEEVKTLSDKLKELDPENKTGLKFLAKIEKIKADVNRKENADKINILQNQIKSAFKEGRFDEMGKTANQLFEIDPKNSFANKYLAKAIKAKEKAEKIKMKAKAKEEQARAKAEKEKAKAEENKAKVEAKAKEEEAKMKAKAEKEKAKAPAPVKAEAKVPAPLPEKAPVKVEAKAARPDDSVGRETPVTPVPTKPVAPAVPLAPRTEGAGPPKLKAEAPPLSGAKPAKTEVPAPIESDKGNIFTKMFGKKEELEKPSGSIIDTIVAKTAEKKVEEKEKRPKKEKEEGLALVGLSRLLLQFSLAFIIISAGFFYVQNIDANNTVLGFFGIQENYASRLHSASEILVEKEDEERSLTREINRYKAGYDNKYETIIEGIIDKRLNWPDILVKINEIANAVYERNEISQYITFDNFSFDAEKGQVRVSGSLSDPLGKNLTKLAELEETFRYFPKDPDNPDDPTKPYFYDVQEFSSLSKSYDRNTGKYKSNFSISFSLQPTE